MKKKNDSSKPAISYWNPATLSHSKTIPTQDTQKYVIKKGMSMEECTPFLMGYPKTKK